MRRHIRVREGRTDRQRCRVYADRLKLRQNEIYSAVVRHRSFHGQNPIERFRRYQ